MKHIQWEGDSKDVLRTFPEGIRKDLGTGLMYLQCGALPLDAKSLKTGMSALSATRCMCCTASRKRQQRRLPMTYKRRSFAIKRLRKGFAMKKAKSTKAASSNVFEELGFSREESLVLTLKAQLAAIIVKEAKARELTQKKLSALWDVPQPRVSEVMTGKLALISVDRLVEFLGALGIEVMVQPKPLTKLTKRKAG